MKLGLMTVCVSLLVMAACTTTGGSPTGPSTRSGIYQNSGFSWRTWPDSPNLYLVGYNPGSSIQLSNGRVINGGTAECLRMGGPLVEQCYNAVVRADRNAGFTTRAQLVNAARQAVQSEGRCRWVGYDPSLDARTRATGALASQSDNGLFFTTLQCA